jgi:hypothetical protein
MFYFPQGWLPTYIINKTMDGVILEFFGALLKKAVEDSKKEGVAAAAKHPGLR